MVERKRNSLIKQKLMWPAYVRMKQIDVVIGFIVVFSKNILLEGLVICVCTRLHNNDQYFSKYQLMNFVNMVGMYEHYCAKVMVLLEFMQDETKNFM